MKAIERLGKTAGLVGVLIVSIMAGLFVAAWEAIGAPSRRGAATKPATGPATTRTVDTQEVKRGQPWIRDMAE
jgi:hypothetical protein